MPSGAKSQLGAFLVDTRIDDPALFIRFSKPIHRPRRTESCFPRPVAARHPGEHIDELPGRYQVVIWSTTTKA